MIEVILFDNKCPSQILCIYNNILSIPFSSPWLQITRFYFNSIEICGLPNMVFDSSYMTLIALKYVAKSTHSRCAKCQIFGTFGTLNTKNTSHQMFYMCQIFTICIRTVANLQRYGHKCQTEKYYFIRLFSLLSFLYLIFSLSSQNLPLSPKFPTHVLPLLTIRREQEEGNAKEGGGGGQERRKGSRDCVKIGRNGRGIGFIDGGRWVCWVCHGGESLSWVYRWW